MVPRGNPQKGDLVLDMSMIDQAEARLSEVRITNQATSKELEAIFNEAANLTTKYLAWVKYEILGAKKNHQLNRATVVLDKLPAEAVRLKESGIKMNEDYREAFIIRDKDCDASLDRLNTLEAVQALLEAQAETFIRAHYSARSIAQDKSVTPTPSHSTSVGSLSQPEVQVMGGVQIGTRR